MRHCWREARPIRITPAMVISVMAMVFHSGNKGSVFIHRGRSGRRCRRVAICLGRGWSRFVAPRKSAIVKQLTEQYEIGNGVVYG